MRRRFTGLPLVGLVTYLHPVPRQSTHEKFMRVALVEAEKGWVTTSPNPAVEAVLVLRNRIIARGHHRRAGGDHAEIDCLRKLADPIPAEAILYVTLDPWTNCTLCKLYHSTWSSAGSHRRGRSEAETSWSCHWASPGRRN